MLSNNYTSKVFEQLRYIHAKYNLSVKYTTMQLFQ